MHPKQAKKVIGHKNSRQAQGVFSTSGQSLLAKGWNANIRLFSRFFQNLNKQLRKIKKMAQEKVTRDELREMRVGQTRIFTLMEAKKVTSASVTAQQLKNEEGLEFTVKKDYKAKSVSITRMR